MKNKLLKSMKFLVIITLIGTVFANTLNVNAAAEQTITLGDTKYIGVLIGNVGSYLKFTKSGKYIYCIDRWKYAAKNTTGTLVGEKDAGFAYIIGNGYPNKTFTGDEKKDYYITQTAIWWYIDEINGNNDSLNKEFKTTASDPYNLRPYIKKLVSDAKEARKNGYAKTTLTAKVSSTDMSLSSDSKYYVSSDIEVKSTNVKEYTVSVTNAPSGTKIVDTNGNVKKSFSANQKFKIQVPVSSISGTSLSLSVTVNATGTVNKVYEYKPSETNIQNFIPSFTVAETTNVSDKVTLNISSTKVTIVKLDKATNKTLAGAKLVVKDSSGKVISKWTSTTNAHVIRNLAYGTYTVEEESAPTGYKAIKKPITFKVTSSNKNVQVRVYNEARESVVTITKIDKETEKALAGAVLVVKKSDGTQVARFTTTTEPYSLLNLENGTYTIEEESAPTGYKKSDDQITFTIDDNNLTHQITFENYKEIEVPDTGANNQLLMSIIGIIIISSTVGLVYKNAKKAK